MEGEYSTHGAEMRNA